MSEFARIFLAENPHNGVQWYDARRVQGKDGTIGLPLGFHASSPEKLVELLKEHDWPEEFIIGYDGAPSAAQQRRAAHGRFMTKLHRGAAKAGIHVHDDMSEWEIRRALRAAE